MARGQGMSVSGKKPARVKLGSRLWNTFKDLSYITEAAIIRKQPDAYYDLEVALRKHKPDFLSLLKNPAKNPEHRKLVKNAMVDGIGIDEQPGAQKFPQAFIDEALIISDLFNLNEYSALELLIAGEQQQPHFPDLTRGLVAVLLYYDGRLSLLQTLRTLIQARHGRTWTFHLASEQLTILITNFTDQLKQDRLIQKLLDALESLDPLTQLEKLEAEQALGNTRHRKQVMDLLMNIRLTLAECVFCWSCQSHLTLADTTRLLSYLQKNAVQDSSGRLDKASLVLFMAFLYSIDVSVLNQPAEEEIKPSFVKEVHKLLLLEDSWQVPELKHCLQFAWAVSLQSISQEPLRQELQEYIEEDEYLIDTALSSSNVFKFFKDSIFAVESFHQEEFFLRRMHSLITDFIVQMPMKVKELRNHGDEDARIIALHQLEGIEPPSNLRRDFEYFLKMIGDMYRKDELNLKLSLDFWCPVEPLASPSSGRYGQSRPPQRQVNLFKFVCMAGDLLPPSLYIPYINMLTGLASGPESAHYCYNLLKTNGMVQGGDCSTVSWDHFFHSINRYYTSLRQELPSVTEHHDTIYRHAHSRGITLHELEGLQTVLILIQQVVSQNETARVSICENQTWLPVVLLFGLLTCSVPPVLKAELLHTLAAFGKSPEIAATLWQSLEVSQILPTVKDSLVSQSSGIQMEIDEIEARNEEFPMTLGFLDLLNTLTNISVPSSLGAGFRAPGFDPYLKFIQDSIFLKFDTRTYKVTGQKWEIAARVLDILFKLLHGHESNMEDFVDQPVEVAGHGVTMACKPPGHTILIHMLNDSPLLKKVLQIIDKAIRLLDTYKQLDGHSSLKQSALFCLKLIDTTLEKQAKFLALLREGPSTETVTLIDKLLLGINPRTGKADHLVNIAKFVLHSGDTPECALHSVKILCSVAQSSVVQPQLVGMFTAAEEMSKLLLHGFVECLENDDFEEPEPTNLSDILKEEPADLVEIRNGTRQYILRLIQCSLNQPAPNLGHFLLGFELRRPVSLTTLQDPGTLGTARTCLHSVLTFLERGMTENSPPVCVYDSPHLAELAYQTIYQLVANKETSTPTLRYLRATQDFFCRHLKHLPFVLKEEGDSEMHLLRQQSWLLKAVAIEVRVTALNRQHSHTRRILQLLLEDNPTLLQEAADHLDDGPTAEPGPIFEQTWQESSAIQRQAEKSIAGTQVRRKILCLLDSIEFSPDVQSELELDYFDPGVIERVMVNCGQKDEQGLLLSNIQTLHQVLMSEVNALQGSAVASQRQLVTQEVQTILHYAVQYNFIKRKIGAKKQFFDAWHHVTEVVLTACPVDSLVQSSQQDVTLELLQDLLIKVSVEDAQVELTSPVAGVILTLMSSLRQNQQQQQAGASQASTLSISNATPLPTSSQLITSPLSLILRGLIEFILNSGGSHQRVRTNLYGALLNCLQNCLQLTKKDSHEEISGPGMRTFTFDRNEKLVQSSMAIISSYGDKLMEMVCRDGCDSHNVGKMLALSTLDVILSMDRQQGWLHYMISKGYVRHMIQGVLHADKELQNILQPTATLLKALYVYESQMALLTRIAETLVGALDLLQAGLLSRLSECKFIDLRPEHVRQKKFHQYDISQVAVIEEFIPGIMDRYRQLLFPALKICLAITTSLGIQHREASLQVLHFLLAHKEVVSTILREHHQVAELKSLMELSLLTSLIYRVAGEFSGYESEFGGSRGGGKGIELQGHLSQIRRQMVTLFTRYCATDYWSKLTRNTVMTTATTDLTPSHKKAMLESVKLEIVSNLTGFCRLLVVGTGGSIAKFGHILFLPTLSEATSRVLQGIGVSETSLVQPPSLGVVLCCLRHSTTEFMATYKSHNLLFHKLLNLDKLKSEDYKEILEGALLVTPLEKMQPLQRKQLAQKSLKNMFGEKEKQMNSHFYIIENCLFLLWRHFEFYFIHCTPADSMASLFPLSVSGSRSNPPRRLQELPSSRSIYHDEDAESVRSTNALGNITRENLELFKQDAFSCFKETFFKSLHDIHECYGKNQSQFVFILPLVRRIKRLLQLHANVHAHTSNKV